MKRKIKRQVQKKWKAFLLPLGLITTLVIFIYNSLKDSILPELVIKIRSLLVLDEKSIWPILIILIFLIVIILSISSIITRLILFYNKPDAKYFQLVDFEKPTHKTIKKAVEGILNSEKTKPYFIHAAPINDEIEQFYEKLDNDSFVWENGKPGDGKSMLAYQALYRYRKIVSFTYGFISIKLFKRKYRVYELKKDEIADVKEILAILDELYSLKGGRRIIILVDDAHKLSFEDKLRREFEKEAKDAISGKFVWISTNYLTGKQEETNDSINISFEKFYPKLLNEFYGSQHPIIKDVIKNKCKNLHEAKELTTEKGRIKDPWHFNFIATNGEKRISELLLKLSPDNNKQDTLLLSIFLFSCRNIITGEKEIHQREFIKLLTSIEDPNFKKDIEIYQPSNIISDLASTDKGRFLIIENKNSLNRGFLRAPHFRLSIAIIKSVIANFSENSIKPMINASKLLFTENFVDSKYFGIYFNALGVYQDFFLRENNDWVKKFLNNIILDQLHVYPYLLYVLKNYHRSFYMDLITDGYLNSIASQISVAPTSRFSSIQNLIKVLGNDKENLVKYLNWETLAKAANKAEVAHFGQLEAILNALGNDKENLVKYLNWET
ncbi:MAG: hypothetical protein HYZ15_11025, partial [Sphingobacteriales bacterium]|nr:hypothetical protein [Sphingobacteriales bacterium]